MCILQEILEADLFVSEVACASQIIDETTALMHWFSEFRALPLSQKTKERSTTQQVGSSCCLPPFYKVGQNHKMITYSIQFMKLTLLSIVSANVLTTSSYSFQKVVNAFLNEHSFNHTLFNH